MISVHEQQLEARPPKQVTGGAEKAAPFRLARQVAEVAEADDRVAALLDGALDQPAEMAAVAVHVAYDEQTAHSAEATARALLTAPRRPLTVARRRAGRRRRA